MSNPRNSGTLIGRLARDPNIFRNRDGSHKVLFTIHVDRDYVDAKGERPSDAISVEAFISAQAKGLGPYPHIHRGDLVALSVVLRLDHYAKDGKNVYDQKVRVEDLTFLEPQAVTQERLLLRVQTAESENKALRTPAPAAIPTQQVGLAASGEQLPFSS